jgi:two-component sensor histidine kinase
MIKDLHFLIEINALKEEIAHSREEILDIMNNIEQGLLTCGPDGTINQEYSKATEEIFHDKKIAGRSLGDLIFDRTDDDEEGLVQDKIDFFNRWLENVFFMTDEWENFKDLAPTEVKKSLLINDEKTERFLEFGFQLLKTVGDQTKMMVIVTDITTSRQMQEQLDQAQEEENAKMSMLMEIINLSPNVFIQFLEETNTKIAQLKRVHLKLIEGPDPEERSIEFSESLLDEAFSICHSIKGSTRFMGLMNTSDRFHRIESRINRIKKKKLFQEVESLFEQIETDSKYFVDIVQNLLQMIKEFAEFSMTGSEQALAENTKLVSFLKEIEVSLPDHLFQFANEILHKALTAILTYNKNRIANIEDKCKETVERLCRQQGKEVALNFEINPNISYSVITKLQDIIIPTITNAVDHGIETQAERSEANKPGTAQIKVSGVIGAAGSFNLEIADDGRGINIEKLKERALASQSLPLEEVEAMSEGELLQMVLIPSVSTKDEVSKTSGRGYGMDIVKRLVLDELKGEIAISSQPQRGTTFKFSLPTESIEQT